MDGEVSFSESDSAGALEELDRGLRCGRIGEQCGALGRIPFLLERYPFPLFINSSVLKMAEVFKEGGNLLRNCIVKVAERSGKHLEKITSVDEVLKRIFAVSHSNDPEARALTLRLLGFLASIFAEKKSVHHLLSKSFESRDYDELQAAIEASQFYAKYSPDFSHGILEKVEEVLLSMETPVETKMKLIPIFRFMYRHAGDVNRVMRICKEDLLSDCPDSDLRLLTLNVLTGLSSKSQLIIQDQIELLLDNLNHDASGKIHGISLRNLKVLAGRSPHTWDAKAVKRLGDFCLNTDRIAAQNMALKLFASLTRSKTCAIWLCQYGGELKSLCLSFATHSVVALALNAVTILSNISHVQTSQDDVVNCDDSCLETDALLPLIQRIKPGNTKPSILQGVLKLAIVVVLRAPEQGVCLVKSLLALVQSCQNAEWEREIVLCLTALAEKCPEFYPDLHAWAQRNSHNLEPGQISIELGNLVIPPKLSVDWTKMNEDEVLRMNDSADLWKTYQFGRKAMKNGWPALAARFFQTLIKHVVTSTNEHYLRGLIGLCEADSKLECLGVDAMTGALDEAYSLCLDASQQFQLAGSLGRWKRMREFEKQWIQCRLSFLEASRELTVILNCLKLFPPPASTLVSPNPKGQMSKTLSQLSKCAIQFRKVGNRYGDFIRRSFDCQDSTLHTLRLLQLCSVCLEKSLGRLLGSSSCDLSLPEEKKLNACNRLVSQYLSKNVDLLKNINNGSPITPETAMQATECLLGILTNVLKIPLYYPRCFFQVPQMSHIRLKLTPQPLGTNKSLNVAAGQELVVSVQGLTHTKLYGTTHVRTIAKILLHVSLEVTSTRETLIYDKDAKPGTDVLTKTVEPHNDYFAARFLICFPQNFQCGSVLVTADIIDSENEEVWSSGSFSKLKVNMVGIGTVQGTKRKLEP